LFIVLEVKETIRSVVTIKCALNRFLHKGIKQGYKFSVNYLDSFGAEVSNRDVVL